MNSRILLIGIAIGLAIAALIVLPVILPMLDVLGWLFGR